ncbi:MAG: hypothetical protein IKU27_05355 [Clostridia bacterium]|nr:hypothetical protein [Clostridia bacterium]
MYVPHLPTHAYDDIIDLPRPVSRTHKPMSMHNRAAQFSPFSALTGYEAVIEETGRLTEPEVELDEQHKADLNDRLQMILHLLSSRPPITVTWFCPDERKSGGAYLTHTGILHKIDPYTHQLRFEDGTRISIDTITEIEMEDAPSDIL